ncbi:winged helix-turn-helix transcriptional regulator [Streptomyces sp. NPDC058653]|uniref:winged helix-turn-helix transcriptional regulator n=1 Tax=Streptomyces sp. NPDC058653 TaxID=3346576 RepID=UPI00365993D0
MTRSYEQACFIARALDVLGERWTLLILRELTLGPRRYGDLLNALPGIGTSLLAARLRHLERYDAVRRTTLHGVGNAGAYELGDRGEAVIPVLKSLAEWGAGLEDPPPDYTRRTAWRLVAMRLTAPDEAVSFDALTQLEVGEERFWLRGDGDRVQAQVGVAPTRPDLRLRCGTRTFGSLAGGEVTVDSAIEAGELVVEGEIASAREFFELFSMPGRPRGSSRGAARK